MVELVKKSNTLLSQTSTEVIRPKYYQIQWDARLIAILGARGVGKTTLLLQHLKNNYAFSEKALYVSMDDKYFLTHDLMGLTEEFRNYGGEVLYLDEVHKYEGWAREVKNIYDLYKDIKIVLTGSSIIDILRQDVDLSRRVVPIHLHGLSFREYLIFNNIAEFQSIDLAEITSHHISLSHEISDKINPIPHFKEYLQIGYYPFFLEGKDIYPIRLENVARIIIENDLKFIEEIDPSKYRKIYQLFYILASNVPFKPNISKLSRQIGLNRNTLVQYLYFLEKAKLLNLLHSSGSSISTMQKPDKVLLENTNYQYVFAKDNVNPGTLREIFFVNQLKNADAYVSLPKTADFFVNDEYIFEVGGKNKSAKQIKDLEKAYLALDDIETASGNRIPLWLFGFLT